MRGCAYAEDTSSCARLTLAGDPRHCRSEGQAAAGASHERSLVVKPVGKGYGMFDALHLLSIEITNRYAPSFVQVISLMEKKNVIGVFQDNEEGRTSHYVLPPGEKGTPFATFVKELSSDIMCEDLPKGQVHKVGAPRPAMLKQEAQFAYFKVINMALDVIESGSCFEKLHEDIITITDYFELPRLLVNNLKERTPDLTQKNVTQLGEMLDRVTAGASQSYEANNAVNPEFKDLLKLLKNYGPGDDFFIMRYPSCNCPLANKSHLFVTFYDFTMDILRYTDQEGYTHVMTGLVYPHDWDVGLQENTQMVKHYNKGDYDPRAINEGTDPRLEPLRLQRNSPCHPYQGTFDPNASHGMTWTREDISHAFYFLFPRLVSSMQISLSFMGELQHLKTEHLFAFCIKKTPAA